MGWMCLIEEGEKGWGIDEVYGIWGVDEGWKE